MLKLNKKYVLVSFLFPLLIKSQIVSSYFYTGAVQYFTVPCGVTTIHVSAWGAGGSGGGTDSNAGAIGGGGGFISADIATTPFSVFTIIVGGGALGGSGCGGNLPGGAGGFGFGLVDGGNGGNSGPIGCSGSGGGGGAGSALFFGATPLLVAGGGGGGSGGGQFSSGGAGGGAGQNGFPGGVGGCSVPGVFGGSATGNGQFGASHLGDGGGGGGGGGGFKGGGLGNVAGGACDCGACGGGGGTSFSSGTGVSIIYGSGSTPGNNLSPLLPPGVGLGGNSSTQGGNGFIAISYTPSPTPTVTINGLNTAICLGQQTSTLVAGGANSYSWAPSVSLSSATAPTVIASPTANTIYTVTGTSSGGCWSSAIMTVNVNPSPIITLNSSTICALQSATLGATGAVNYTWSPSSTLSSSVTSIVTANPLVTTVYSVAGIGANGCVTTNTTSVFVNPVPSANFNFINYCINTQPNSFDASLTTIAVGTVTNYAWNFGDTQTSNLTTSTVTHTYNSVGSFPVTLTASSNSGCVASISHTVQVHQKPIMSVAASSLVCLSSTTTFTAISASNSGNVVLWQWDLNNGISTFETTGQQSFFAFPTSGTHTICLVATTDNGCKDTVKRTTYVNYIPVTNFSVDQPKGCPLSHCVTFTDNSSVIAPASIKNWNWNFGNSITNNAISNVNQQTCYTNTSSNQLAFYTVTLTTTTDSGCVATEIKKDMITVYPKPIANYTITPNFGTVVEPSVEFTNQSMDYNYWYWIFGDGSEIDSTELNPSHYYNELDASSYLSGLVVKNQYGCLDTAKIVVDIVPDFVFYIPNAFSPNGDGINEGFTGAGIGIAEYEMWIFNRWGEQIYYTNDIKNAWNGKVQGKDLDCKQDVYTWKVELKDVLNKPYFYAGHVTLLRKVNE